MLIRILIAASLLLLLWILLSGHLSILLLSLGIASGLLVAWLIHRLALQNPNFNTLYFNLNLPRFLPWFFLEVVRSNLDVSWRILHPKLPISPNTSTVSTSKLNDVATTTYANCITLTPGTYTLNIDDQTIEVHSLTQETAEKLQQGKMKERIFVLQGRLNTS